MADRAVDVWARLVWKLPGEAGLQAMADLDLVAMLGSKRARHRRYFAPVAGELDRRDRAARKMERRRAADRARRRARNAPWEAEVDRRWLAAENGIQGGVLLNRAALVKGTVSHRDLFKGHERVARARASQELLNWWDDDRHPEQRRITRAEFEAGLSEPEPDLTDPRNVVNVA